MVVISTHLSCPVSKEWRKFKFKMFWCMSYSACLGLLRIQANYRKSSTGSLTMKCAKVKAYITPKYWLSVSQSGFWASATSGHLWKCKANLSKLNGSRDMTFFSLVFQRFTVHGQIRVWKMFLAEKKSYLWNHLTRQDLPYIFINVPM